MRFNRLIVLSLLLMLLIVSANALEISIENPFSLMVNSHHWKPGRYLIKLIDEGNGRALMKVLSGSTLLFKLSARTEKLPYTVSSPVAYIERQGDTYRIIVMYRDIKYISENLKVREGELPLETVVKGDFHQGIPKRTIVKLVITNSLDWERAWNKYVNKPLGMMPPQVDFSKHMLVGICWQVVKGQWTLTIKKVTFKKGKLTVFYTLKRQSPNAWSAPYHIVRIPKVEYRKVEFKPTGKLPQAYR